MAINTKTKLLTLALKFYAKKGAHNLSFQHLADQLGISQAAIYKHFKSKDELMVAAIRFAADEGQKQIQDEMPVLPALELLKLQMERNITFAQGDRIHAIALLVMHYYASSNPEVKKLHEEINERRVGRIEKALVAAVLEKKISNQQIREKAEMIHSLLIGEMIKAYLWPESNNIRSRVEIIWKNILVLLGLKK